MDKHSKATRSYNMSRIRSKNTKPEILLRKALWAKNIRFRIHEKGLPGNPDIVIKKYKLVIFVDGEFWHGYNWDVNKKRIEKSSYWLNKIETNIFRDKKHQTELNQLGYNVMRFWGKEIQKNVDICVNQVALYLEAASSVNIPPNDL